MATMLHKTKAFRRPNVFLCVTLTVLSDLQNPLNRQDVFMKLFDRLLPQKTHGLL